MNKQEVIEKLRQESFPAVRISNSGSHGYEGLNLGKAIDIIEQLDEPQKVKVSEAVASWYEENKDDLDYSIWEYIRRWNEHKKDEFWKFMNHGPSKPFETLIRMKSGYEVEEPEEWVVRVKGMYFLNWGEDGTCPTFVIDDNPRAKLQAKPFIKSEGQALAESLKGSIEKV